MGLVPLGISNAPVNLDTSHTDTLACRNYDHLAKGFRLEPYGHSGTLALT